ncbi:Phosphoglycolate phosphatase [Roseivivax sp. THAF40]|uniref:HAD-IA family hydrolase n=1 Tax=unclassified Roseivivax TaxID=2639302 RepID=UPI001267ABC2|nr:MULTISPECIES: HAD-IA family hydrolase [unclassified Roseivivax]QFS82154.1 Phosphoglycolate phosphatase [Roseivivax sp. THAF197b]QFT45954.1 Phosphoglycolate phosphatase [Roseivivax sp. THAF40]
MRTVIFDLDGTLADTSGDLIGAANVCFVEMGYGPLLERGADDAVAFRGARAMLRRGLERQGGVDEAVIEAWYPRLLEAYGAAISEHSTLYPGAMVAVEALKSEGIKVGICTNKPSGLAETLLRDLGIRDAFGSMIGADTLPVRKPDPAPFFAAVEGAGGAADRACLVGDTETDRETARAAGVPSILVGFGPEGPGIARLAPEAMIAHYDELPGVVADLLGH